nr:MAG TPA: hypothetical protein [Caudoviricetes sp.]
MAITLYLILYKPIRSIKIYYKYGLWIKRDQ